MYEVGHVFGKVFHDCLMDAWAEGVVLVCQVFNDAIEALRVSYRKMNPFCVPFATTNMGSAMLAMDLVWLRCAVTDHDVLWCS